MSDNDGVLRAFEAWHGAKMAIATVISTWGSAPRPLGSHMLVHEDGRLEGSVSGGCVEGDVLNLAADVIAGGNAERRSYGISDGTAWEVGLPCGGNIEVLVQPVGETGYPEAIMRSVIAARRRGEALDVFTDLESGVSCLDRDAISKPFVNRYLPARRLLIVGAVQIAQALAGIVSHLDTDVTVIDPRTRFLTRDRFGDLPLDDRWPDEAISDLQPDVSTAVVTLSHDPKIDDPALIAAMRFPTGYIGALGSRKSHAARLKRLAEAGVAEADLSRIDGPAGIDIGSVGAGEIALSIAAGMFRAFSSKNSKHNQALSWSFDQRKRSFNSAF